MIIHMAGLDMARILIVDDNPDLCFIMNKLIERMGHEAITAANGLEALHSLERNAFDIVITDIIMPNMDGIELITQICSKYPQMKVIAISGEDRAFTRKLKVDCTLLKPFPPAELFAAIKRLLA
jgi:CheY-like chemotaxis protein